MSIFLSNYTFQKTDAVFIAVALLCLTPWVSSPIALVLGFALATLGLVPKGINLGAITKKLLAYSIIGLGFGIHLETAIATSREGFGLIVSSIFCTLTLGLVLTKLLRLDKKIGYLIASGTAICGGSAIAAVAPAINAKDNQTSLALATVFILNSIALFLFPVIGHLLDMSQHAFGVWSAIAIHDTSSVVGAASAYGDEALLIIPIAFISALLFKGESKKIAIPYFIFFYCLAILVAYLLPQFGSLYQGIFMVSKQLLIMCLFMIGAGITLKKVKEAGAKPLLLGVSLWLVISSASLAYILWWM